MVKIHQRQFWHLTLDVLLDDKHDFMTKLRKDTNNALHLLRFEEILGVVDKYHLISGLNEYQVFHPLSRLHHLMESNNVSLCNALLRLKF